MNSKFKIAFFLSCILSLFMSCRCISGEKKYSGFESVINVNEITAIIGAQNRRIIDLKIPLTKESNFDYNKMLDSIHFIKLETTPESVIGNIDKIFFTGKKIIIVDFKITETVFIFNVNGGFLNKISANKNRQYGSNSNDLSHFFDVCYYFDTDEILLHDDINSKLYYFDCNGNFKRTEREYVSFFAFNNLRGTDNFVYLDLYTQNDHIAPLLGSDLYLGKKDTRILHTAPNAVQRIKINENYHYKNNLSSYNSLGKVFYTPVFSDTIYEVDGNPMNVYPKFVLHYQGQSLNTKIRKNTNISMDELINLFNTHQYFSFKGELLENQDSIFYIGCYKNGLLGYFYSEKSQKIIGGNIKSILTKKDSAQLLSFDYPITSFQNYFVSIAQPHDMKNFINTNTLLSYKLTKVITETKENDNPVLVLYKLKDF